MNKDYSWQNDARKIVDKYIASNKTETIGVSACVGSGKTCVAAYAIGAGVADAIGKFVAENVNSHTFSVFVCPIIRLCDQQKEEIKSWIETDFPQLAGKIEFRLVHCKASDGDRFDFNPDNDTPAPHLVVIMCADSLWGKDDKSKDKNHRWHRFQNYVNKSHRKSSIVVLDEEHNYASHDDDHIKWIGKNFKVLMRMSGTPSAALKTFAAEHPDHMCECSFKMGVDGGLIAKPILNYAVAGYKALPNVVSSVFDAEIKKWKDGKTPFKPVVLVNCGGIEHIHALEKSDVLKDRIGKDFKWIAIHSTKIIQEEEDSEKIVLEADIDGKTVESDKAWAAIESIDKDTDPRPVVVVQVDMIGEGINVKSFTSTIITTGMETKAMQQVGRVVRDCEKSINGVKKTKICDGQANIYVLDENMNGVCALFAKLSALGLCDGAYSWGQYIPSKGSSASKQDDDDPAEARSFEFEDVDRVEIRPIEDAMSKQARNRLLSEVFKPGSDVNKNGLDDYEEWLAFQQHLQNSGVLDVMCSRHEIKSIKAKAPEVLAGMLSKLERWFDMNPSHVKYIDKCGFGTIVAMIFHDEEIGKFFDERLTDEQKSVIAGRKPANF